MASSALLRRRHRLRKSCSQPKFIGQFTQQSRPRMSGDTLAAGGHHNVGSAHVTLHLGSALLVWFLLASQSTVSFTTRAFPRQYGRNDGPFTERSGLISQHRIPTTANAAVYDVSPTGTQSSPSTRSLTPSRMARLTLLSTKHGLVNRGALRRWRNPRRFRRVAPLHCCAALLCRWPKASGIPSSASSPVPAASRPGPRHGAPLLSTAIRNSPLAVIRSPQGRPREFPADGHGSPRCFQLARGTTPLPEVASTKRIDSPSVTITWA